MKRILLCSSNPLLTRSLYGMLRDEGYAVEDVEHPALAVRKVLDGVYDFTIIDAEPFGLSAEDAAHVITAIAPGMPILCVGDGPGSDHLQLIKLPADLAAIRELIHVIAA
jgi:DNA-binding response OmpR family regulator